MGLREKFISAYEAQKMQEANKTKNIGNKVRELTEEEKEAQKQAQYKQRVKQLIRQRYTLEDEVGLLRQQIDKDDEYKEYYAYCELCKTKAKAELQ